MPITDTLSQIETEQRLPTLAEAAAAAKILLYCNGVDIDEWTKGAWFDGNIDNALKALVKRNSN